MNRSIKIFFIILLFFISIIISGCWSRIEVENLAIASAIGIDKVKGDPGKILFSVSVLKPPKTGGGGGTGGMEGGSNGQIPGWVNFGQGNSVEDARRNLATTTAKRLFLGHSRIIVFGKEKAQEGIEDTLDFLSRNEGIRLRNWVLVASEGTALDTFSIQPELTSILAEEITDLLTLSAPRASKSYAVALKDFMVDLTTKGKEAVLPLLEIREISPDAIGESQGNGSSQPKKIARLKGVAVFKGDKMVGELGDTETKGFLWIIGKVKKGILTFEVENSETKKPVKVTVEMTRSNSKIEAKIIQGKPVAIVRIDTEGNIDEFSKTGTEITPKFIELVDQGYEEAIRKEVMLALNKCQQELESDIFGLGTHFHRQQLKYWKENNLDERWPEVFPDVQVQVEVTANVRRTGLTSDSIVVK
ncbi:MAG: Ger(x)C family spore germination protein [Bacillota bacterium]|jgi:spore germination protein KC